MSNLSKDQVVGYIRKLEKTVKKLQEVIKKRDEEIHVLRHKLTEVSGDVDIDALVQQAKERREKAAQQEAEQETAQETPADEAQPTASQNGPQFKKTPKTKPLEEKRKTFVKKAAPGADQRVKEAASEESPDEAPPEETAQTEETPETGEGQDEQSFAPSIHFEPGHFFSKVIEGEEEADEMKSLMEKLGQVEEKERRQVFISMTGVYWRMVKNMGKRLGREDLPWEKRLCMRYGMLDESLMEGREDLWEKLYTDKSHPEETGIYFMDEWLEQIARGRLKYSTIDEMALDGKKPNQNATGEEALQYELINVPQMQRMCVGPRANTITIMAKEYCNPTRDNPMLDRPWIQNAMKETLKCDYTMFQRKYKGEDKEVEPLFILLPGYGLKAGCWEPYSPGKKGTTGPRICYCVFPQRKPMKTFLMGIADYRWEYAKADAMHYWLTEGLTGKWIALFNRKEQRKDLKEIFLDTYFHWVTFESRRIPKIEKRFREFLYYNCPFSDEIKQNLKGGGMFARMIELEEQKKKREEEEQKEIERIKAEREKRKAARKANLGV